VEKMNLMTDILANIQARNRLFDWFRLSLGCVFESAKIMAIEKLD